MNIKRKIGVCIAVAMLVLSVNGCASLKSKVQDIKGNITGATYTASFYSNTGDRFLTVQGQKINLSSNIVKEAKYDDSDGYILQHASDEVAKYDRQRNDEEEYAEYFLLDVKRGFEFYKRFREIRQKRRFWKDLDQIAQIAEPFMVSFDVDELARISKCVEMARGRVYRLRDPEAFVHKERVCKKPAPEIVDSPKE